MNQNAATETPDATREHDAVEEHAQRERKRTYVKPQLARHGLLRKLTRLSFDPGGEF